MTAHLAIYGRLGRDPYSIETKNGKPMAVVNVAVEIGRDGEGEPLWIGLLAFGRVADDLLRHRKGDLLSAFGRLQRRTWKTTGGEEREQLQIVAETIISARTTCPGKVGNSKPADAPEVADSGRPADAPADRGGEIADDEIPF